MTDSLIDVDRLRRHLTELPELAALLHWYRLPGSVVRDDQPTGRSDPAHRSVLNMVVLDLLDERTKPDADPNRADYDLDRMAGERRQGILPTLSSWVRLIDGELWDAEVEHDAPDDNPTIVSECAFINRHALWLSEHQWSIDLDAEVWKMVRDIRHAIGSKPEQRIPCEKCGWNMDPQGEYDKERERFPWYRCGGCGHNITTQQKLDEAEHRAKKVAENSVTLKYAAQIVGRPPSTLRHWQSMGWIESIGRDKRGWIYSLDAILRVSETVQHGRTYQRVQMDAS